MAMQSFNLKLLNIFIGLFVGGKNRFLREYSSEISILGYRLIEIEPTFRLEMGSVNPEALAHSQENEHSLMVEWTQHANPFSGKDTQIRKYLRVEPHHLSVKVNPSEYVSTWLIVDEDCKSIYTQLLDKLPGDHDAKLMLCTFSFESGNHSLQRVRGHFEDSELSDIVQKGILVRRVPLDYVRIDTSNLQLPQIEIETVRQLVNFCAEGREEFTSLEVVSGAFGDAWNFLSEEKQKALNRRVLRILKNFSRSARKKGIERVKEEPPTWIFKVGINSFQKKAEAYIRKKGYQDPGDLTKGTGDNF